MHFWFNLRHEIWDVLRISGWHPFVMQFSVLQWITETLTSEECHCKSISFCHVVPSYANNRIGFHFASNHYPFYHQHHHIIIGHHTTFFKLFLPLISRHVVIFILSSSSSKPSLYNSPIPGNHDEGDGTGPRSLPPPRLLHLPPV